MPESRSHLEPPELFSLSHSTLPVSVGTFSGIFSSHCHAHDLHLLGFYSNEEFESWVNSQYPKSIVSSTQVREKENEEQILQRKARMLPSKD